MVNNILPDDDTCLKLVLQNSEDMRISTRHFHDTAGGRCVEDIRSLLTLTRS